VAILVTIFTWPLLFVGGLVTTYRFGMAVPDWPTTFGMNMFVYDMSTAAWSVLVEHGHRLYGAVVGVGALVLATWMTLSSGKGSWKPIVVGIGIAIILGLALRRAGHVDPLLAGIEIAGPVSLGLALWFGPISRRWLAALSWVVVTAVIAQGALGGLRVRLNSTDLAALHGCTGQLFFALMVAVCVLTRQGSHRSEEFAGRNSPKILGLSLFTTALIYGQIVAGAWLRHYSAGLYVHSILAVGVLVAVGVLSLFVLRNRKDQRSLWNPTRALFLLVGLQIALGLSSWWLLRPFDGIPKQVSATQAIIRTAHQANGALVLAAAVVVSMRCLTGLRFRSPKTRSSLVAEPSPLVSYS
jgi:heme a synthase